MKKIIVFALLFLFPITALPHPGKTDKYGGHKCLKGCEEWELYYAEYHLHDKAKNPVRVAGKPRKTRKTADSMVKSEATESLQVQAEIPRTAQTVTVYKYITTIKEVSSINPLLWVVLILLLLLLVLRINRKEEGNKASRL